jgi:hypothetical protein
VAAGTRYGCRDTVRAPGHGTAARPTMGRAAVGGAPGQRRSTVPGVACARPLTGGYGVGLGETSGDAVGVGDGNGVGEAIGGRVATGPLPAG